MVDQEEALARQVFPDRFLRHEAREIRAKRPRLSKRSNCKHELTPDRFPDGSRSGVSFFTSPPGRYVQWKIASI